MFGHHQLWFQQHQHDFTGCGAFAQKQPTSQKDGLESQRNLNTWTINSTINLLQVFYGHLCSATIKILLTASLNLLNLFFLSTFEQIIPWGNSTAQFFFFLPRTSSCKPRHTHTGPASSFAACGQRSPVFPSHDDDVMTPNWLSDNLTGTEQEKTTVRVQEKKHGKWRNMWGNDIKNIHTQDAVLR